MTEIITKPIVNRKDADYLIKVHGYKEEDLIVIKPIHTIKEDKSVSSFEHIKSKSRRRRK